MSMHAIVDFLLLLLDLLVPRFITEDVALELQADGSYVTVMPLDIVEPGAHFDAVCRVCAFTWFGIAWFGWQTGDPRPFTGGPSA